MDRLELEQRIERAISAFLELERDLLMIDAHEQALTSKFSAYLQEEFSEWDVDAEYDKLGTSQKRVPWRNPGTKGRGEALRPDIIVHRRNTSSNLLAIEAKKTRGASDSHDRLKLDALKRDSQYLYEHVALILFSTGNTPRIEVEFC